MNNIIVKADSQIVATETFQFSKTKISASSAGLFPPLTLLGLVIYRPVHEILVKTARGLAVMCAWSKEHFYPLNIILPALSIIHTLLSTLQPSYNTWSRRGNHDCLMIFQ